MAQKIGPLGDQGLQSLSAAFFQVSYISRPDQAQGLGMEGIGFFAVAAASDIVNYVNNNDEGFGQPFHFTADNGTAYLVKTKEYTPTNRKAKREATELKAYIHLSPIATGISDANIEGAIRAHLPSAGLFMEPDSFAHLVDHEKGGAPKPDVRFEVGYTKTFDVTKLKTVKDINIAGDILNIKFSQAFCEAHSVHRGCLKIVRTSKTTADAKMGDYCFCGVDGIRPSDYGYNQAQRKRAAHEFVSRMAKRNQAGASNPFA